jgi:hypothetical protein
MRYTGTAKAVIGPFNSNVNGKSTRQIAVTNKSIFERLQVPSLGWLELRVA